MPAASSIAWICTKPLWDQKKRARIELTAVIALSRCVTKPLVLVVTLRLDHPVITESMCATETKNDGLLKRDQIIDIGAGSLSDFPPKMLSDDCGCLHAVARLGFPMRALPSPGRYASISSLAWSHV